MINILAFSGPDAPWRRRLALAGLSLIVVQGCFLVLGGYLPASDTIQFILTLVSALIAAGLTFLAVRHAEQRRTRWSLRLIAGGFSMLIIGRILALAYPPSRVSMIFDFVDILFVGFYLGIIIGFAALPAVNTDGTDRFALIVDIAVSAIGGMMIIAFVLSRSGSSQFQAVGLDPISFAYLLSDTALLVVTALIGLRRPLMFDRISHAFATTGLAMILVGDISFFMQSQLFFSHAGIWQISWSCANILIGLALVRDHLPLNRVIVSKPQTHALAAIVVAAAYGALLVASFTRLSQQLSGLVLGATLITGLLVARQFFALRDKVRMLEERATLEAQARAAAETASQSKSLFLAMMSHELRTPLTAILGYSELLQAEAAEREWDDMRRDLREIEQSGRHLLKLVDSVLDLSRIESGKLDFAVEPIDLVVFLEDLRVSGERLAAVRQNSFEIVYSSDVGMIEHDPQRLYQILMHLLDNAAKFTACGKIGLHVMYEPAPAGQLPEWIGFEVRDTGIGMDSRRVQELFEPFTQEQSGFTRRYGGIGMGLTISRRLVTSMGGSISVTSEVQGGSIFTVRLPVHAPTAKHE